MSRPLSAAAFDAHLALHGLVRYEPGMFRHANVDQPRGKFYVAEEHLIDMFRMKDFLRIDQYGDVGLQQMRERAVPGFDEFGMASFAIFYADARKITVAAAIMQGSRGVA